MIDYQYNRANGIERLEAMVPKLRPKGPCLYVKPAGFTYNTGGCCRSTLAVGRLNGRGGSVHVTRVLWEVFRGPIPTDWVVDHLCYNEWCVDLDHLECVTKSENARRAAVAYGGSMASGKRRAPCPFKRSGVPIVVRRAQLLADLQEAKAQLALEAA